MGQQSLSILAAKTTFHMYKWIYHAGMLHIHEANTNAHHQISNRSKNKEMFHDIPKQVARCIMAQMLFKWSPSKDIDKYSTY